MKPDIFTYLDYRVFLKDAFDALKAKSPRLSYRTFAKRAGFSTPNFLQMVIQSKRSLSSTYVVVTASAFKLNKQETEFFQNLVSYDQARSVDEKNLFYQRILKNKRFTAIKTLDRSQYDFFSHWYVPVVRELLTHRDFQGDSHWIAERIFPRITVAQVESAKNLLLGMGLIRCEETSGKWHLSEIVLASDSESSNLALRNYHTAAIQLAQDSLKAFPQPERDIRSVTVGLSQAAYGELKSRMETFWKEIMDFAGSQTDIDSVYQVNMQVFPLTRERKAKDD